jgi:uncharacterized protein YcfJ
MKNFKAIVFILAGLMTLTSVFARQIVLNRDTPVFAEDRYGNVEEKVTFLAGTRVVLYDERAKVAGLGSAILVKRINNVDSIRSDYRYGVAIDINRTSHFDNFYIREADLEGRVIRREEPRRVTPRRDYPRRDVVVTRPSFDYAREYEVCYETPRRRVVTMNEEQRRRGNRNVVGGILTGIGGQILGGVTGNDRLGDIVSAIGIGFAAVGAVQVASSQEVFYTDYDIDCRSYYKPAPYVHTFRRQGQRCSTTRYYTNRWGQESEYFETVCTGSRTSRFVTFEYSHEIYRY